MISCRIVSQIITIVIFLFIFSTGPIWGQKGDSADNIFGFAESLYEEGDYFRAIGEYKRFIFLNPAAPQVENATFRIAESYFHAQRWSEAINAANQFLAKYRDSPLYFQMLYLKGRVEKLDKRYDEALRTFDALAQTEATEYHAKALYQKALIHLERADWQGARDLLLQVPRDSSIYPVALSFAGDVAGEKIMPRKSPAAAGILAAALPGAGHLYAGRPHDAVVAFLLNGAFIWGAVELFRHDENVAGGILSLFELGWYSGNIYSAISSAHKYNRGVEEEFIHRLENKYIISFHPVNGLPTIMLGKRF